MADVSRDDCQGHAELELWDQGGFVGALVEFGLTARSIGEDLAFAAISCAKELDRERRGDLSVLQRGDSHVVEKTILRLLDEPELQRRREILPGLADEFRAKVLEKLGEASK